MKTKVNDTVKILRYDKGHMNYYARVVEIVPNGILVSNMNMPFQGTLSREFIKEGDYEN